MLTNEGWTEERTMLLKTLWSEGVSCQKIADEIGGITRNAVIGKVDRLGLEKRKRKKAEPKDRRTRRSYVRLVPDLFEDALPPPDFLGIPFVETDKKTCMYPEGDGAHMLFCGQPQTEGSSYCEAHRRICYTPARVPIMKYWRAA